MTIKNKLCSLTLFLVALFNSINTYADEHTASAVIVNQSNADWLVKIVLVDGTLADASECQNKQECLIPKNTAKVIFYKSEKSVWLSGAIEISDMIYDITSKTNIKNKTHIYMISYDSVWYPNTPYIEHDGNTGSVDLNKPLYGGLTINADSWCGNL